MGVGVEKMIPFTGYPESVAIVRARRGVSPRTGGVAIYDYGVARPKAVGVNTFAFGVFGNRAYGYVSEHSGWDIGIMRVTSDGIEDVGPITGLMSGYGIQIQSDNGLIYASNGQVIDPESWMVDGSVPVVSSGFTPDASVGRAFFATGDGRET